MAKNNFNPFNPNSVVVPLSMVAFFALVAALIILLPDILSLWPTPETVASAKRGQDQASIAAIVAGMAVVALAVVSKKPVFLLGVVSPLLLWLSLNTFIRGTGSVLTELVLVLSMPVVLLLMPALSGKGLSGTRINLIALLVGASVLLALYSWFS